MGSLYLEPPVALLQDLKVTIHDSSLIFPSKETEKRSMFLSNIDQVLNFDVETVHFFPCHKDFPPPVVAQRLKNAIADILVPYDFFAGRVKINDKTGRLEIDCNAAGVGFVVASSEYTLDEVGDLVYPNPAFGQLVQKNKDFLKPGDQPICIVQFTSFKCGGSVIGFSMSHTAFDGPSVKAFFDNLAALAANKPLVVTPCNDRQLLAARSPPRVTFPHPEFLKLDIIPGKRPGPSGGAHSTARITSFNVVTAHIWRCKALCSLSNDRERASTILYAVDLRSRLNPPLPKSYAGNAVVMAYATAKCKELEEGTFSSVVEMVTEGARRISDEYARSVIDWGELYKGIPYGEVLVSSWWRLGFEEVEYPWGKPRYSCPVVYHKKDIVLLFPDIHNKNEGGTNDGVIVLVALPHKEMDKFQTLFHKFLI
ncbi:Transferase [Quillaja saponaria]|uniref:Transferase n=1 Tax=Quillaja saponaria TaxID=32244 RepID=A0AAD7PZ62_QUISA|nr:Transferase [Quillaja saponaria]